MAAISAALVKQLREETGAGMMDCRTALGQTHGDLHAAAAWLCANGAMQAARKADRVALEGLAALAVEDTRGAIVELNSETDFVARNGQFQRAASTFAALALEVGGDRSALMNAPMPDGDGRVADRLVALAANLGENIHLRRTAFLSVEQGRIAAYVHNPAAPGLGAIGVLTALESPAPGDRLMLIGRQIAMHVAAAAPLAVSIEAIAPDFLAGKRTELAETASVSGKTPAIVEKMIEGRWRKFCDNAVLLRQPFVLNPEQTVAAALDAAACEIGAPIRVREFVRFRVGEGSASTGET